ncbi:hypothetical protein ACIQOV_18170 [Kitasatospora sp. NPDC091257]|uniref:hypothetical protein n=1 Tax=Kitasatospora sp. NPDC091257 TaxID=3364084 RepID=UPI003825B750
MDGEKVFEFNGMVGPDARCLDGGGERWTTQPAGGATTGHAAADRFRPATEDEAGQALGGGRSREARTFC